MRVRGRVRLRVRLRLRVRVRQLSAQTQRCCRSPSARLPSMVLTRVTIAPAATEEARHSCG